jgi:threonine dehydrogenase-like Zn-dependent dehydrogenase
MRATVMYGAFDVRVEDGPDALAGRIQPGRVFDRTTDLDGVPEGYRAMNDREALKVLVDPA